jgi:hypothetical protein
MSREYTFFYLVAFFSLWFLSVLGGIAVVLSRILVEEEYDDEGILTRGSQCSVRARALLTSGCTVFWICTVLGHALSGSSLTTLFGFWQDHPVFLVILFFLADFLLVPSVVFAWQASGSGRWVLSIATPIVAFASLAASFFLFMSAFATSASSF